MTKFVGMLNVKFTGAQHPAPVAIDGSRLMSDPQHLSCDLSIPDVDELLDGRIGCIRSTYNNCSKGRSF